jgi:hypothetical protein
MSASRDTSQRFKFVYSNLYLIYKSGKSHELIGNIVVPKSKERKDNVEPMSVNESDETLTKSLNK